MNRSSRHYLEPSVSRRRQLPSPGGTPPHTHHNHPGLRALKGRRVGGRHLDGNHLVRWAGGGTSAAVLMRQVSGLCRAALQGERFRLSKRMENGLFWFVFVARKVFFFLEKAKIKLALIENSKKITRDSTKDSIQLMTNVLFRNTESKLNLQDSHGCR